MRTGENFAGALLFLIVPLEQYHALNVFIFVQTQAHIFLNDRELEFDGLEPLAIGLTFFVNLYFRNVSLVVVFIASLSFNSSVFINISLYIC